MPNTFSQLYYHFVFATKYREAMLRDEFREELHQYISGIVKGLDQTLIQINSVPDYCHLLVRLRPAMAPSVFVQKVKSNSSGWINKKGFLRVKFQWQTGSGIFTVGPKDVEIVKRYIQNQQEHHRKTRFRDEYLKFLKNYGIEYDDRFLPEFFE